MDRIARTSPAALPVKITTTVPGNASNFLSVSASQNAPASVKLAEEIPVMLPASSRSGVLECCVVMLSPSASFIGRSVHGFDGVVEHLNILRKGQLNPAAFDRGSIVFVFVLGITHHGIVLHQQVGIALQLHAAKNGDVMLLLMNTKLESLAK